MTSEFVFIEQFPEALAAALNTSEFVAGLILSAFVMMILMLPIIIAKRGRSNMISEMILGLIGVMICMALTWLPSFVGLVIGLALSLFLAQKVKGLVK